MLAVIGAVGQAEREAVLERQREGIAKAKREGRYKGRVPTARRQIIKLKAEPSGTALAEQQPPSAKAWLGF
jgi:DNA invertase Pin-like site-specific DNA recombinase